MHLWSLGGVERLSSWLVVSWQPCGASDGYTRPDVLCAPICRAMVHEISRDVADEIGKVGVPHLSDQCTPN